nr:GntR family transcriptional regulator [Rhabdothermincola salaria]
MRHPRVAELVAGRLRERILDGDIPDGGLLPSQEKLLVEFKVSKPSLREALRILETEGLLTVRRGKIGGAVVHVPEARDAAYNLGLALQAKKVAIDDVGQTLRQLESACAGMCAARPDRNEAVVPVLRRHNAAARDLLHDELAYVEEMAEFHESIVGLCGSPTMQVVAGAIESLWLAHVRTWAQRVSERGDFPDADYRRKGLEEHELMADLIEAGEVDAVTRLASSHFDPQQFYDDFSRPEQPVRAAFLRHEVEPGDDRSAAPRRIV